MLNGDHAELLIKWENFGSLRPLWDELARRMGASDRPVRTVRLGDLDDRGRRTLASIFGLPRVPKDPIVTVDIPKLCAALHVDDVQLRRIVEHEHGPLGNRAASRLAESSARSALWARAEARFGSRVPRTLERLRAAGIPTSDFDANARALDILANALDRLPALTPIPLPMLAWQVCADPHALDSQTIAGHHLRLAAVELAGDLSPAPDTAATRRALRAIGVVTDRLSTAITYGLRARPDTGLGRLIEAAAEAHVPLNLSGAALDSGPVVFVPGRWLCLENRSVFEAALLAGYDGPLVCTSGWPSVETQRLLDQARKQGVELRYAGDYDPEGLAIAAWIATRYGVEIVMTAEAYLTADRERGPAWGNSEPSTPWDDGLAAAIREWRKVVFQEDPAIFNNLIQE